MTHKQIIREQKKRHLMRLKLEVLAHYGNSKLACVRCGFAQVDALTIDHVNGGGTKHKAKEKIVGNEFYSWLKRRKFPDGFQTLCMNCQYIKRVENKEYSRHKESELIKHPELVKAKIAEFVTQEKT